MTVGLDDLRRAEALAGLPDDELAWLAEHSRERTLEPGEVYFHQGEPAERMVIVLEGAFELVRRANGNEESVIPIEAGEVTARLPFSRMRAWGATGRALEPTRVAEIGVEHFQEMTRCAPVTVERLVNVMLDRTREFSRLDAQRQKLVSLGTMAAGLAHELNNPASAAQRAAQTLVETLQAFDEHSSGLLREALFDADALGGGDPFEPIYRTLDLERRLDPVERGDLEDELADWLEARGVPRPWDAAATLVGAGFARAGLAAFAAELRPERVADFLTWLRRDVELRQLAGELTRSTERIAELVGAMKSYTYMDQSTDRRPVAVRDGIDDTLAILRHKIEKKGVVVERRYGEVPAVLGFGGELNQVWTNLLDNAVAAVDEGGRVVVATTHDPAAEVVCVEVVDDGHGIPEDLQARIFEPFFTTKPVGEGTGLGLDIANRIVTKRHRGTLSVESRPGRTRFLVRLPAA